MKTCLLIMVMAISINACSQERTVSDSESNEASKSPEESKFEQITSKFYFNSCKIECDVIICTL